MSQAQPKASKGCLSYFCYTSIHVTGTAQSKQGMSLLLLLYQYPYHRHSPKQARDVSLTFVIPVSISQAQPKASKGCLSYFCYTSIHITGTAQSKQGMSLLLLLYQYPYHRHSPKQARDVSLTFVIPVSMSQMLFKVTVEYLLHFL